MESLWGRCFPSQALMLMIPLLLAIPSPSFQTAADPSSSHTLERTVGDSVQLHLISSLSPNVREVEWSWQSEPEKQQFLVSWKPDDSGPDWYELEGKFRSSLSLTEMAVLSIRNLSTEMSGWYTANVKFHTGKSQKEVFRLCVYEPIPHPQIVIHSPINPAGWCQVSLECETPGSTENWTVTWLTEGLPRELEQSGALRPAPSSRNVNLSLPLSQVNGYLTCLVSNPVEEKNATLTLQSICLVRGSPDHKWLWRGVLPTLLMMSLAGGVYVCMRKKMQSRRGRPTLLPTEPGSAGVPQALPTEEPAGLQTGGANSHCHPDVEMSLLRHHKGGRMVEQEKEGDRLSENDMERSGGHPLSSECTPTVYTIYEKVRLSREPQEDT
ncbi:CD48 antigen-like isoform X1 [Canis lupus baileyi]|uniref:CD48 antigen-like isoform X1 n=2 Tax=Canis lupus baileyi TaxID=143281 RepID=UPI003B9731FC